MSTYRAKLIIERVELRRPMIRGTEVPKEATYNEVHIEVTSTDSDIALSKIIGLAQAEQTDRDLRKMMDVKRSPADLEEEDEPEEEEEEGEEKLFTGRQMREARHKARLESQP